MPGSSMQAQSPVRARPPVDSRKQRRRARQQTVEAIAGRDTRTWKPRSSERICEGETCGAEWDTRERQYIGKRVYPLYYGVKATRQGDRHEDVRWFCFDCWSEQLLARQRLSRRLEQEGEDTSADISPDSSPSGFAIEAMEARGERLEEEELPPEDEASLKTEIERYLAAEEKPVELVIHFK